jgi:hypothetical protein
MSSFKGGFKLDPPFFYELTGLADVQRRGRVYPRFIAIVLLFESSGEVKVGLEMSCFYPSPRSGREHACIRAGNNNVRRR